MKKYPMRLVPQERRAIWGRELWLVSAHPAQPSVVQNGLYAGRTLPSLVSEFGTELCGTRWPGGFPLLTKIIEARDRLSLQVHPNEETSKICGGDPKTEMWHVLDAGSGACVFAGFSKATSRDDLARSLHDGTAEDIVKRLDVRRGDTLFIPGGLVHAIGGGCRLYEVQQTSDTTWRLHDWSRTDPATGKPRKTNEREGLDSIDWSLPPPELIHSGDAAQSTPVDCAYFRFSVLNISDVLSLPGRTESFRILFASGGKCAVAVDGCEPVVLSGDESALLPAGMSCEIVPDATAQVLVAET